jgi:hypothetical protein
MKKGLTWPNYAGEPRMIPGVPSPAAGYGPGVVLPLSEIGVDEDEAAGLIAGTPLEIVDVKSKKSTPGAKPEDVKTATESEVAP